MRIVGNNSISDVNTLHLRLKNMNTNLHLYIEPIPFMEGRDLGEPIRASIQFNDTREIDALIDALQKFKTQNERYIGSWK